MIQGLDFVSLPTRDMARSIAFYRDALGLTLASQGESNDWVEYALADGMTLAVMRPEAYGQPFAAVAHPTFALRVADVQATIESLRAAGVAFAGEPFDSSVCHMGFFADPDGNALMLHHRYAPQP